MYYDKQGYRKLLAWQYAYKLRRLVYKITVRFPKIEYRRVTQMRDSARSIKQNIQEGYKRKSRKEYIQALTISQGSLGELLGDIEDCFDDGLITKEEFEELDTLAGRTDYFLTKLLGSLRKTRMGE